MPTTDSKAAGAANAAAAEVDMHKHGYVPEASKQPKTSLRGSLSRFAHRFVPGVVKPLADVRAPMEDHEFLPDAPDKAIHVRYIFLLSVLGRISSANLPCMVLGFTDRRLCSKQ